MEGDSKGLGSRRKAAHIPHCLYSGMFCDCWETLEREAQSAGSELSSLEFKSCFTHCMDQLVYHLPAWGKMMAPLTRVLVRVKWNEPRLAW